MPVLLLPTDLVVPRSLIAELGLEAGAELTGLALPDRRCNAHCVAKIESINGHEHADWSNRTPFRDLVAEENAQLRRENERLHRRLQQAETIIGVQKKVSELLGIPLDPAPSDESNS